MKEIIGDFWDYIKDYDAICITTNGVVRFNGELVMGAGIALQAKTRYPVLPSKLGYLVKKYGNKVILVDIMGVNIISYPTKHHYKDISDISLIVKSAIELVEIADNFNWSNILLPRPGCGLGQLNWNEVKNSIENILDDRFTIITTS